jgi:hypothetical protein
MEDLFGKKITEKKAPLCLQPFEERGITAGVRRSPNSCQRLYEMRSVGKDISLLYSERVLFAM